MCVLIFCTSFVWNIPYFKKKLERSVNFCVLCGSQTNWDYFPIQHQLTGFYTRDLILHNPVVTTSIYTASLTLNNSTFCPHSVFMCFIWIWEQRAIFPYTALTGWFLYQRFNPLQPSGHYMYHQFNFQQFYVLPTQCVDVFCVDLRTNSDYFPIQH